VPDLIPRGRRRELGPVECVKQCQESNFLPLRLKLLRDLERYGPTHTITTQKVRPVWLRLPNFFCVQLSHILDRREQRLFAIESLALQAIERLIVSQAAGQIAID